MLLIRRMLLVLIRSHDLHLVVTVFLVFNYCVNTVMSNLADVARLVRDCS